MGHRGAPFQYVPLLGVVPLGVGQWCAVVAASIGLASGSGWRKPGTVGRVLLQYGAAGRIPFWLQTVCMGHMVPLTQACHDDRLGGALMVGVAVPGQARSFGLWHQSTMW